MSKVKQTALAVAGVASVFVAGSSIVDAASTYTVKQGDTLSQLADKFNMTVDDLIKSNNLKDAAGDHRERRSTLISAEKNSQRDFALAA
jgi:LysM repeat protein